MNDQISDNSLPHWCESCDKQGVFFVNDYRSSYLVIHKKCGEEILYTNCPKCDVGNTEKIKSGKYPTKWKCGHCSKKFSIASEVFQNPITMDLMEDLPDDIQSEFTIRKQTRRKSESLIIWGGLIFMILNIFFRSEIIDIIKSILK